MEEGGCGADGGFAEVGAFGEVALVDPNEKEGWEAGEFDEEDVSGV